MPYLATINGKTGAVVASRRLFNTGFCTVLSIKCAKPLIRGFWLNCTKPALNGFSAHVRYGYFTRFVNNKRSVYTCVLLYILSLFVTFRKLLNFSRIVKKSTSKRSI